MNLDNVQMVTRPPVQINLTTSLGAVLENLQEVTHARKSCNMSTYHNKQTNGTEMGNHSFTQMDPLT